MKNIQIWFPNVYKRDESGFTLIEMAIVLVIVGIIISIMATVLPSLIQSAKIRQGRAILEKFDYTFEGYITANGRCPCPDTNGDGSENRNDGGTPSDPADDTCAAYVGDLPYLTLGLSSGDDNWHNRVKYGVYEDFIKTTTTGLCDSLDTFISTAYDSAKLHTTSSGGSSNQAYVIVSGGPQDLDGTGGYFDGLNAGTDMEFEIPDKIVDANYDDLVRAVSFSYLKGKDCSGGSSGGGTGNCDGIESINCGNCDDGVDNDNDGAADCNDTDCATYSKCVNPTCSISQIGPYSQDINSSFSVTLTASAGCVENIEWGPLTNGGFTDFYLHPYTGLLSGTLNQCPGTYTVTAGLTDSDSPAHTPTMSFDIEVKSSLQVARTSGDGSVNITWSSATQQETFKANGGHLGLIDWTLNTGGATGFTYASTGEDTCVIKKDGTTTAGTYTFTLTATDHDCTGNTANMVLSVTVSGGGSAAPYTEGMEAEWRFDECTDWDGTSFDVVDSNGDINHYGKAANGAVAVFTGKNCRAASFDGTDDKIISDVLTGADIMTFNDQVTLACWFKSPGGGGTYPRLIEFSDAAGSSSWSTALCYDPDGSLRAWVADQSGGGRGGNIDYSAELYNDNKWHHAVYTYSAANGGKLYVDSVLKQTATDNPTSDIHDAETFVIGGYYPDTNNGYKGLIDEAMVFHRELTAGDVTDLYNLTRSNCSGGCYTDSVAEYRMENYPWNGTADEVKDTGTGGSNGVAAARGSGSIPGQTTPSGGKEGLCRAGIFTRIDGNNGGYLDMGDPADGDLDPGALPWTISAWIKWDGSSGENIIYNKENLYETRVYGGYIHYAWQPHWAWDGGTSFPVTANTWTYVTVMYDGSQQSLYKDGVLVYSRNQTGAMGSNTSKLLIGARGNTSARNFFGGMIDEIKIYNRTLAENEIKEDMSQTHDCSADSVVITSTSLDDGTINSSYSYTIAAAGGTTPYGWQLVSSAVPGLSIVPNTGELSGTIDVCAGDYSITVRVTDAASRMDERTFTLTVVNGTLTISPSSPRTFNCTTADFNRDFSVSGVRIGAMTNWAVTWLGTNPGGFEAVKTGDASARFRKIGTSTTGTGYQFKLTANDGGCSDNTVDSGYYTLNVSGSGTDTPYYAGRVGEWWLDESGGPTIEDHSGQNNNGTASGGITYQVQGKVWTALQFDGSSGYVDCGNNASLDISTGDFTVGAWVKPETVPQTGGYFVDKGTGNLYDGYGLAVINDKFAFVTDGNGSSGGKSTLYADGTVSAQTWYHIVGVRESGVKKLYVDKVLQSSTPTDARELSDTSQPFYIGRPVDDGGYFEGAVDEVVVYNRALSQSEITDLYNQASLVAYFPMDETAGGTAPGGKDIYDYSGQGNHGTNNGAAYGVTGKVGTALEFDGSVDVNIGHNLVLSPPSISMAAWVKASAIETWNGIMTNIDTTSPRHGLNLQIGTSNRLASLIYDGSGGGSYVTSTTVPGVDTWYHVVVTHNDSDKKTVIYVNGNNEKETTAYGLAYLSGTDTVIGRFYTNSTGIRFKGVIDEVRIYNRALSGAEVLELYNKGVEEGN